MPIAILTVFAAALAAPFIFRFGRDRTGWILAILPLGLFGYFASFLPQIANGESLTHYLSWVPSLGISFSFHLDGLALLFALLITGIGTLIFIYAGGYLAGHRDLGRIYVLLLLFMGSMLGVVLADNALLLFVFWELTSISSYLLIGFDHERPEARAAAFQALFITGSGGLAMLAGLVLLGQVGGTLELSALAVQGDAIRADALYLPILLLILAGAFTKSAQFPFHFWLPGAMAAPTPVSAYLHSATMVKAGVYLIARLSPVLGGTEAWLIVVTAVGAITMVVGSLVAFYQTDLKQILAFSTVGSLGTLVMLLGIGSPHAVTGALVFLLAHALYKGALFMIAGAVDHETGTRDVERLGGLRKAMPITAAATVLAGISLAGFGPVLSFIGKELVLESTLHVEGAAPPLVLAAVLMGALSVAVAGVVTVRPFFNAFQPTPKPAHEAPISLRLGPMLLATLGVVFGIVPGVTEHYIVAPSALSVLGQPAEVHLGLWHGITPALGLSVVAVALGIGLYLGWAPIRHATPWANPVFALPARGYRFSLAEMVNLASTTTHILQNGYLRVYLMVTILTAVSLAGYALISRGGLGVPSITSEIGAYQLVLAVLTLAAALFACLARSRLAAVASLSVVGYSVALTYILNGAPDLAMTQVFIETLTVILFVLVFYHLPGFRRISDRFARLRDAAIALVVGGFMTALVLAASSVPTSSYVSEFYAQHSVPEGHGRNIVNVILVDFRVLDTMGEITVLAVAAWGVYALLRLRPQKLTNRQRHRGDGQPSPNGQPQQAPAHAQHELHRSEG